MDGWMDEASKVHVWPPVNQTVVFHINSYISLLSLSLSYAESERGRQRDGL